MSRQNAMSAVASVSTPGVLPTAIFRAVAAGMSMLLKPTAKLLTTLSRGAASKRAASILSVRSDTSPSQPAIFWRMTAYGGGSGSAQISASQAALMRSSPTSGMMRVTNTFGLTAMNNLRESLGSGQE